MGAQTRPAGPDDQVGGVPARLVAAPESTQEAAALLRQTGDLAVAVRGGGTKLDQGVRPQRLDLIIDTGRLTGIVEHAAGDLIVVVRAGTPLSDLDLGDQQLAVDAPPGATVGGTVASNASGPRRLHYGTPRDLLIGITVVRPDGVVARAGGKVVKNVAGYDLGRLFTGSYGTLGLITECVFRLHPRPPASAVVRRSVTDPGAAVAAVLAAQVAPAAVEINVPAGGAAELAVLVEGTAAGVAARAATLDRALGGRTDVGVPAWWDTPPWTAGQIGLKLTAPLSRIPDLLAAACDGTVRGSAGTGVLYAGLPADPDAVDRLRAAATRAGGHAVVLAAPPNIRDALDVWGPVAGLDLMRRVKEQFDPGRRFAPGRFVGGI